MTYCIHSYEIKREFKRFLPTMNRTIAAAILSFCLSTSELAELRQVERATRFSCDVRGRLVLRRRHAYRIHTLRRRKSDLRRD